MVEAIHSPDLPPVVIALLKGVVDRETDPALWQSMLMLQSRIRDYVGVLGLDLTLDEAEGYAYLKQRSSLDGEADVPRLVARRQLGYGVSLLLALLRKKLAEFDATSGEGRLILDREAIADMVCVFLSETTNEVRLVDRIDVHINRIVQMGFLRRLPGSNDTFEVKRLLKAFVDAQWLADFNERLTAYRKHAMDEGTGEAA
jgi:hypothetical protein